MNNYKDIAKKLNLSLSCVNRIATNKLVYKKKDAQKYLKYKINKIDKDDDSDDDCNDDNVVNNMVAVFDSNAVNKDCNDSNDTNVNAPKLCDKIKKPTKNVPKRDTRTITNNVVIVCPNNESLQNLNSDALADVVSKIMQTFNDNNKHQ
jgi:DNA-directed RNA polymerase specialized sigma54-like protein